MKKQKIEHKIEIEKTLQARDEGLSQEEQEILDNLAAVETHDRLPKLSGNVWLRFFKTAEMKPIHYVKLLVIMGTLAVFDNIAPLFVRYSLDHFIAKNIVHGLGLFALLFGLLVFFQSYFDRFYMLVAGKIESDIAFRIRENGFNHLSRLSFSYYDRTAVGWIIARMINDITNVTEVLAWTATELIWCIVTIALLSVIMLILNWKLALLILIFLPLATFIFKYFQIRVLARQRELKRINSAITASYSEGITGAATAKTLAVAEPMEKEFRFLSSYYGRCSLQASKLNYRFGPTIGFMGVLTATLILSIGGVMVNNGNLTIGTLSIFFVYSLKLWWPLAALADFLIEFQSAQAAIERVLHIFDEPHEIIDKPEVIERYGTTPGAGREPWPEFKGKIEFKNVSFAYVEGEPILENFNLTIEAGEKLALVGETGAGKSTLVNLACRFYEPQSGEILFDGVDYREYPMAWIYHNLGYVLQTPQLFSGTIADNIRYGRLNASDEAVREAARLVEAEEFILRREAGYEAQVGEAGSFLSTGEKQLISFARAVIADPTFFVLDEATSSIDTETEKRIQNAIEKILENRTALIVAHRLSTIRNADRIIVIENGKIIEEGSHRDLMARRGRYHTFYTGQFKVAGE